MFEIKTSGDKLRLLESDYGRFVGDPLNISLAEKCIQDAWHLADWDFKDQQKIRADLTKKQYRIALFRDCPEMRILHDLCVTMKHNSLDNPKAKIEETQIHRGAFNSSFSKAFDISRLQVIFDKDKQIDIDGLIKVAINHWTKKLIFK